MGKARLRKRPSPNSNGSGKKKAPAQLLVDAAWRPLSLIVSGAEPADVKLLPATWPRS